MPARQLRITLRRCENAFSTTASSVGPSQASRCATGTIRTIADSTCGGGSKAVGGTMNISFMS